MKWTHERLVSLIEGGIGESVHLEFKDTRAIGRSDAKKDGLSKCISALANADGGDVVFGVRELNGGGFEIDEGVDRSEFDQQWLDNVLGSIIRPKIPELVTHPVPRPKSVDRVTYVVQVPRSHLAPHMARDHRYYRRRNVKSEPMEEYEVREMYRRVEGPILRLELEVLQRGHGVWVTLRPTVFNDSVVPAEVYRAEIFFPASVKVPQPEAPWEHNAYDMLTTEWQGHASFQKVAALTGSSERATAFLGVVVSLPEFRVNVQNVDPPPEGVEIISTVMAPHMLPRVARGRLHWEEAGWTVELGEWRSGTEPLFGLERWDN